jgi:hypothetical protein
MNGLGSDPALLAEFDSIKKGKRKLFEESVEIINQVCSSSKVINVL